MRDRKRRKRILIYFAAAIFATTVFTVAGENGLIDVYRFEKERKRIVSLNAAVEEENKRLVEEIRLLKEDRRYVANLAREELGMLGKDEVIYKIEKTEKRQVPSDDTR